MNESPDAQASIPLVQENLTVAKHSVETGRVRIRTVVDEKLVRVSEQLERDDVTIERVSVNREVTQAPEVREENGVLIVPVLEEIAVVEKRLFLKEELHVHRNRRGEPIDEAVRLRSTRVEAERVGSDEAVSAETADSDTSQRQPRRCFGRSAQER
jgi:uncharacterized protein (TIGR02271 family)